MNKIVCLSLTALSLFKKNSSHNGKLSGSSKVAIEIIFMYISKQIPIYKNLHIIKGGVKASQ